MLSNRDCDSFLEEKKKNNCNGRHREEFYFFLRGRKENALAGITECASLPRPFTAKQLELQMHILMSSLRLLTLLLYSERGMGM